MYGDLFLRGQLPLDKLVSKTYPLEQVDEAYADMLAGETGRRVIVFE